MTKWITNSDFAALEPIAVFGKQLGISATQKSKYRNKHILFRKRASIKDFEKATLIISADDYYKLYINEKFVCMGPSSGYPSSYYCNELDVTEHLRHGENLFAVHTWYMGLKNRVCVSGDNLHGLYFELYLDGKLFISSDESWKTAYHTGFSEMGTYGYETGFCEVYDCNALERLFWAFDFDEGYWQGAVENTACAASHRLTKRIKPISVYELAPSRVEIAQNGKTIKIDIGRELCGYLTYKAVGKKGSFIVIKSGEELTDEGDVRFEARCNCRFYEKHILADGQSELSQFDYKGMRYIQLELPDGCSVDIDSVKIIVRHAEYSEAISLLSQNKTLQRVLRLCADTVKYGVGETCVDCPTREKGQYLGDAGFIGMSHACLTGSTQVLEKVLCDFAASAFICPGLMAVSGCSFNQEIADYSLMYPYFALWCYNHGKNEALLRQLYPTINGLIKYFDGFVRDGVLCDVTEKWNLVDWPDNLRDGYDYPLEQPIDRGKHNVIAAYYIGAVKAYNEIRRILGMPPLKDLYALKKAFKDTFFDEEKGLFTDSEGSSHCSIHSNILPILFEIETNNEFIQRVIEMIRQKRLSTVNYFAFFILSTLDKLGEHELLRELICDDGAWKNMLDEGATACFEAWGKEQKWNTSLFHPWMSFPVIFAEKILKGEQK